MNIFMTEGKPNMSRSESVEKTAGNCVHIADSFEQDGRHSWSGRRAI